jgi:hypothetical protein
MGREGEVLRELVPAFERAHPGVVVRVQQIPWSAAHEKLLTAFVGGALPDVFQVGNTWIAELATLDAVRPVDDLVAPDRDGSPASPRPTGSTVALGGAWYVDTACCSIGPTAARAGWDAYRRIDGWEQASTASSTGRRSLPLRCPSTNGRPRSASPSAALQRRRWAIPFGPVRPLFLEHQRCLRLRVRTVANIWTLPADFRVSSSPGRELGGSARACRPAAGELGDPPCRRRSTRRACRRRRRQSGDRR